MKALIKVIHYILVVILAVMIFTSGYAAVALLFGVFGEPRNVGAGVIGCIFTLLIVAILIGERKLFKKIVGRASNEESEEPFARIKPKQAAARSQQVEPIIPERKESDMFANYEATQKEEIYSANTENSYYDAQKQEVTEKKETFNALKGVKGELSVDEKCVRVKNSIIPLPNIEEIVYKGGTTFSNGFVAFCTGNGMGESVTSVADAAKNGNSIVFKADQNGILKEILDKIEEYTDYRIIISDATYITKQQTTVSTPTFSSSYNPVDNLEAKRAKEELKLIKEQRKQMEKVAKCPKCGSTSLSANKKGFGIGKAVVGAYVAGPIGLVAGNIHAKKVWVTCLKCGKRFKL